MQQPPNAPLAKLTPARLWSELDPATRTLAAESLYAYAWEDGSPRAEADRAIAATLRFREQAVRRLPLGKRAHYVAHAVRPGDALASSLLMALHLTHRRALLETFLNELAIPHKNGIIDDNHRLEPFPPERLAAAVRRLRAGFAAAEVELYLSSLLAMDPAAWGGLGGVLDPTG